MKSINYLFFLVFCFLSLNVKAHQIDMINTHPGGNSNSQGEVPKERPSFDCTGFYVREAEDARQLNEYLNSRDLLFEERIKYSQESLASVSIPLGILSTQTDSFISQSKNILAEHSSKSQASAAFKKLDQKKFDQSFERFRPFRAYDFRTSEKLQEALNYRNQVASQLDPNMDQYKDRVFLISIADQSLDQADSYYQAHEFEEGDFATRIAVGFLDLASGFLPGISFGRDVYEAFTGKDLIYGTELSSIERSFAIASIITGGITNSFVKSCKVVKDFLNINRVLNATSLRPGVNFAESILEAARGEGFTRVYFPRGVGAVRGSVPDGYVKVSRWTSEAEANIWMKNGATTIPIGIGANERLYVTLPGAPKPGGTGPVRIDMHVPEKMLQGAGNDGWRQIIQPQSNTPIYNVQINLP